MRTDKRARELAIADNRVAELDLDWNDEVLSELDIDLSQFWNDAELRKLIGQEFEEAPEPQMDHAAELQQKWGTERGQIWEIGRHRVMCGDSTSSGDITLLMERDRAQCMWTDPPYGVSYVGKTKNKLTINPLLQQFLLKPSLCILSYSANSLRHLWVPAGASIPFCSFSLRLSLPSRADLVRIQIRQKGAEVGAVLVGTGTTARPASLRFPGQKPRKSTQL